MDNKITEAIVLAGGLGTRIKETIGDVPKCLAPINQEPFLNYVLRFLEKNGVSRVILSLGYKAEMVQEKYSHSFGNLEIVFVVENEPMGTGGGLKLALEKATSDVLFVLNGDTLFDIDLMKLSRTHFETKSVCTIALKKMYKVDRYGSVRLDDTNKIIGFDEKKYADEVIINGGVYCINKSILVHYPVNTPFSFETNYLQNNPKAKKITGVLFEDYFCDIGVPEDYQKFIQENK